MAVRVLIVDDNDGDIRLIQESFKDAGLDFEVYSSSSGEDGISRVRELEPDLVILDTRLPGMDGFEVCKKIKMDNELNTKVIVMTGVVDAVDAAEARDVGADDYTVKTSDCELLLIAVKKLLS